MLVPHNSFQRRTVTSTQRRLADLEGVIGDRRASVLSRADLGPQPPDGVRRQLGARRCAGCPATTHEVIDFVHRVHR